MIKETLEERKKRDEKDLRLNVTGRISKKFHKAFVLASEHYKLPFNQIAARFIYNVFEKEGDDVSKLFEYRVDEKVESYSGFDKDIKKIKDFVEVYPNLTFEQLVQCRFDLDIPDKKNIIFCLRFLLEETKELYRRRPYMIKVHSEDEFWIALTSSKKKKKEIINMNKTKKRGRKYKKIELKGPLYDQE